MQMRRFEEAESIYRLLLSRAPNNSAAHAAIGAMARAKNNWPSAAEEFRAAVASEPGNVSFRIDLAGALNELSQWEEADQIYESILKDCPFHTEALMGKAAVAKAKGETQAALALFERAAAASPLDLRPRQEILSLQSEQGNYDWRREIEDALTCVRARGNAPGMQEEAAKVLVEYGLTEAARPVLAELERHSPTARQLLLAVRQIDRMGLAQPPADRGADADSIEAQLNSMKGFLEIPVPGSDTILLVFAGTNNRLWMTFSLLHKILRKIGVSIVYCRDLQRVWYSRGIIGLGADNRSTVNGFEELIRRNGAKRRLMLGNCIGCRAALGFGLELGAQGVLGLGPKIRPPDSLRVDQKNRLNSVRENLPSGHKNLRTRYLEASRRPQVTLVFGEHSASDAADARSMADIPGVTLTGIPESSDTDSVKDLLVRGLLEPLLNDFVTNGTVSPGLNSLIAASRPLS
jgi:tetratricopeptide (TPR) repeat protein